MPSRNVDALDVHPLEFENVVALVRATTVSIEDRVRREVPRLPGELEEQFRQPELLGPGGRLRLIVRRVGAGATFHSQLRKAMEQSDQDDITPHFTPDLWRAPDRWDLVGAHHESAADDPLERWWLNSRADASSLVLLGHRLNDGSRFLLGSEGRLMQADDDTSVRSMQVFKAMGPQRHPRELAGMHSSDKVDCSFSAWLSAGGEHSPERLAIQFHLDDWGMVTGVLLMERSNSSQADTPNLLFRAALADAWFLTKRATRDYTLLVDQRIGASITESIIEHTAPGAVNASPSDLRTTPIAFPLRTAAERLDRLVQLMAASVNSTTARFIIPAGPHSLAVLSSVGTKTKDGFFSYRDQQNSITRYLAEVQSPLVKDDGALAFDGGQSIKEAYKALQHLRVRGTPDAPHAEDSAKGLFASENHIHLSLIPSRSEGKKKICTDYVQDGQTSPMLGDAAHGPWCYAAVPLDPALFPGSSWKPELREDFRDRFNLIRPPVTSGEQSAGILKVQGRIPCIPLDQPGQPPPFSRSERRWLRRFGSMLSTVFHQACRIALRGVTLEIANEVAGRLYEGNLERALEELRERVGAQGVILVGDGVTQSSGAAPARGVWDRELPAARRSQILAAVCATKPAGLLDSVRTTGRERAATLDFTDEARRDRRHAERQVEQQLEGQVERQAEQQLDETGWRTAALFVPVTRRPRSGNNAVLVIVGVAPGYPDKSGHPGDGGPEELPRMLRPVAESVCIVLSSVSAEDIRAFTAEADTDDPQARPDQGASGLREAWDRLRLARPTGVIGWFNDFAATHTTAELAAAALGYSSKSVREQAQEVCKPPKGSTFRWATLAAAGRARTDAELIEMAERLLTTTTPPPIAPPP